MRNRTWGPWLAAASLALAGTAAQAKNFDKLLRGDYTFTGTAQCLLSFTGFGENLVPNSPGQFPVMASFSVNGVRTFNGDGTGTISARFVAITEPYALPTDPPIFNRGSASVLHIDADFVYEVNHDLTVMIANPNVSGTILRGPRAGQTIAITGVAPFHGWVSEDLRRIAVAHADVVAPETVTFSNGDTHQRICHRDRVLFELKRGRGR